MKNRERIIARVCAKQKQDKEKRMVYKRSWHLKRQYGVDQDDWEVLYKQQNGVCAICSCPETHINNKTKQLQPLCVDHDHVTGKVRGLLCHRCNRAIGLLGDQLSHIKNVLRYLEAFQVK